MSLWFPKKKLSFFRWREATTIEYASEVNEHAQQWLNRNLFDTRLTIDC